MIVQVHSSVNRHLAKWHNLIIMTSVVLVDMDMHLSLWGAAFDSFGIYLGGAIAESYDSYCI